MNPIEEAVLKMVKIAAGEIASNPLAFEHFITMGKVGDPKLLALNKHIVSIVKTIYPAIEVAKTIIPSGTPFLSDFICWVEQLYPILIEHGA